MAVSNISIALIEPFFAGSHKKWAVAIQQYSQHKVQLFTLKGRHWKWRMHGGAVTLADRWLQDNTKTDILLVTDMLDLCVFLSLTRQHSISIPVILYFHENQLTYPWSPTDVDVSLRRDNHYAFINYTAALAADVLWFNSAFHKQSFLEALPGFLHQFPDEKGLHLLPSIAKKSQVMPLGLELSTFDSFAKKRENDVPILVWNHRWEYDKAPDDFFELLFRLKAEKIKFQLVILGRDYTKQPPIFEKAKAVLANEIIHFGYAKSFKEYADWLWKSDIALVTSRQDFFGISVVEAIYCNCYPILPNRLAYPEHIPSNLHKYHFYNNLEAAYRLLKKTILNFPNWKVHLDLSEKIKRYDWQNSISKYDEAFIQTKSLKYPQ